MTYNPTHGERWHASPSPGFNRVDTLFNPAPLSQRPSHPCPRCGVRENCRHRQSDKATALEREIATQVLRAHRREEKRTLERLEAEWRGQGNRRGE